LLTERTCNPEPYTNWLLFPPFFFQSFLFKKMLEIQKHCTLCDYQAIWINIHAKKQTNFINQKNG
jgi:hypothetical protein